MYEFIIHIIALVLCGFLGTLLGLLTALLKIKIEQKIYLHRMTENLIAVHEAGHVLAWIKYCPWWNNDYAYRQYSGHMEELNISMASVSGYLKMDKRVTVDRNTLENQMLLLGGIAIDMLFNNKKPSLLNLWIYRHFFGCTNDIERVKNFGLSDREICNKIQEFIDDISEFDKEFITNLAEYIRSMPEHHGDKILTKNQLLNYAKYYRNYTR